MSEIITSMSNSQVKNLASLQARGRARSQQGLFVAEGLKMFQEAPREQIAEVIGQVLAELGIEKPTPADKGKIMKVLMPRIKGQADGKLVNEVLASMMS